MTRILESITDGVAIYDRDWRFVFVNQRGAQLMGQPPAALLGKSLWEVEAPEISLALMEPLQRVQQERISICLPTHFSPLDLWLEVRAYPTNNGVLVLYQNSSAQQSVDLPVSGDRSGGTARAATSSPVSSLVKIDRSQRQQIEAALNVTNGELARILESITDGIYTLDRDWRFAYANERAEVILQRNQSELLGRNIWELYPESIDTPFHQHCEAVAQTQEPAQFEMFCPALDRWFQVSLYPNSVGTSVFLQDITQRKEIEQERDHLLVQEQTARTQAEQAHRRCMFLSEAGRIVTHSLDVDTILTNVAQFTIPELADVCLIYRRENNDLHSVAAVYRDSEQQDLLVELGDLYRTTAQNALSPIAQVFQSQQAKLLDDLPDAWQAVQSDRIHQLHEQLALRSAIVLPLVDWDNQFGVMVLAITAADEPARLDNRPENDRRYDDIDLMVASALARRAASALNNAYLYQQAQTSSRLKDEFLTTLSHELRTPLNTIVGWSQILNSRRLSSRTLERALEVIERKGRELTQIVYDLLNISRIVTGQMRLSATVVQFDQLVRDTIGTLQVAAKGKAIHVTERIAADLPLVQGDPQYLRQIVWNLLANAVKFTPQGGSIEVQLQQADSIALEGQGYDSSVPPYLCLKVIDSGVGILQEFLPFVFDRFRQGDGTTTRAHEGLGLGLSLVRHLVELHGGVVQVASEGEGQGATFTVFIPAAIDATLADVPQPASQRQPDVLQVLLVADPEQLETHANLLETEGAEVVRVLNAAEAIVALESLHPHVVLGTIAALTDGEVNLASYLEAEGRSIPGIALIPESTEAAWSIAMNAGFQVYLSQQIHPKELSTILGALARQISTATKSTGSGPPSSRI